MPTFFQGYVKMPPSKEHIQVPIQKFFSSLFQLVLISNHTNHPASQQGAVFIRTFT